MPADYGCPWNGPCGTGAPYCEVCGLRDCECVECPTCEGERELITANGSVVDCPTCNRMGVVDGKPQPIVDALDVVEVTL